MGYSPQGSKESDTTEQLHFHFTFQCLSIPNSISTYRLDNGIALPSRKETKQSELLFKLSHPDTDTHRSGDETL